MGEGEVDGDPAARRRGGGSSGDPGRASPSTNGRERCHGREREAPGARVLLPSLPPLYIGPLGGAPALEIRSKGGRRPSGGEGVPCPPSQVGRPPTPRVSNPRRRGRPMGGAPAHQGLVPLPLQPMGPSGIGGPTRWTPGPFRWSWYNTDNPRNFPGGQNWTSYI